ncbi:MAG: putative membrane protein [Candidatus Latescibacterota bacterium]
MEETESPIEKAKRRGPGLVLRGLCMGTADVIPGVSGGTVALVMGIYDELVNTIASVDGRVLHALLRGRIMEVLKLVNAGFLFPLLAGVFIAIASFAKLITYLLATHPQPVWGFFTGLILASALFVAKQIAGGLNARLGIFIVLGAAFGYAITSLVPVETGTESYKFVLAGMIAICAMILPGISGSFLLVIMGKYQQVFTAVHERELQVVALFGIGAVIGILGFSRLLKRLLLHYHAVTMAFLVGLMLGSLRKVWPFRNVLEERVVGSKTLVLSDECIWPQDLTGEVWLSFVLMVVGAVLVLVLEKVGQNTAPKRA